MEAESEEIDAHEKFYEAAMKHNCNPEEIEKELEKDGANMYQYGMEIEFAMRRLLKVREKCAHLEARIKKLKNGMIDILDELAELHTRMQEREDKKKGRKNNDVDTEAAVNENNDITVSGSKRDTIELSGDSESSEGDLTVGGNEDLSNKEIKTNGSKEIHKIHFAKEVHEGQRDDKIFDREQRTNKLTYAEVLAKKPTTE